MKRVQHKTDGAHGMEMLSSTNRTMDHSLSAVRRFLFILFSIIILLPSCATVRGDVNKPQFISENKPIRSLRICLITDKNVSAQETEPLLSEVSSKLEEQVGMTLTTSMNIAISNHPPSRDRNDIVTHIYILSKPYRDKFDLCVYITKPTVWEHIKRGLVGDWDGIIDDTYRRYIVVKKTDSRTLLHEIYHAFIFSHTHSSSGIMQSNLVPIIPYVPVYLNYSKYLHPSDRKEVLANKWRNFNKTVTLEKVEDGITASK